MSTPSHVQSSVPQAAAGPLNDQVLRHAIHCANGASSGDVTGPEATFLLLVAGPFLQELLAHRRDAQGRAQPSPENVVYLEGVQP